MEQDIVCPSCGSKLFDIDDNDPIRYLKDMVETHLEGCPNCGGRPCTTGVRFE